MTEVLTPAIMLRAYAMGIFPMAASADDPQLQWFEPTLRGILPVGGVHLSRSMRRALRQSDWRARIDDDFLAVVDGCADRTETWINAELRALYAELHRLGHAHALGVYAGEQLIGGMFGLTLGRAFFAESMFSRRTNASKAALIWMSAHLAACGFLLWDTQYPNPHLASLGGLTISRGEYRRRLAIALGQGAADFTAAQPPLPQALVQEITQTS
ncbi:leucyl/phenylalanyl-tRNA--protein transferase [Paracoccus mangrovi]|uniref:Leucyl/phenylalanyl-tRNA--protein transferase n=1 Tax=Paracoccus mangrovi TaxID=1715645 RepID=A0ABV7RBM3_9RHOB